MSSITNYLFETIALRVAEADQPFWYTSGLFGPYYVNTHFLIGSERLAKELLARIDELGQDESTEGREAFALKIEAFVNHVYETNGIYKHLMHICYEKVRSLDFDYISGGERRDFFFSYQLAKLAGVPHLSIFKNGDVVYTDMDQASAFMIHSGSEEDLDLGDRAREIQDDLEDKKVLHVADLVTQASSYIRAWIPSILGLGAKIEDTLAIIDRNQGGDEVLAEAGVKLHSLARISDELFLEALRYDLIDQNQLDLVRQYAKGPETFIRSFIECNPDFLERERNKDPKTAERVARLEALGILK